MTAFLGRERYQRDPDAELLGAHLTRTDTLEALVIAGFVRGLSTRDVEATLAEALGPRQRRRARRR